MKKLLYIFTLASIYLSCLTLRSQVPQTLNNRQAAGYTMFGLGFTIVAYTHLGLTDKSGDTSQRTTFYAVGTGLALTGILLVVSSPKSKKKIRNNAWTGIDMSKVRSVAIESRNPMK